MPRPKDAQSTSTTGVSSARSNLSPSTMATNETNKDRLQVKLDTLATEFEKAAEDVGGGDYSKRIAGCYGHLAAFTRTGSELLATGNASFIPQIQDCRYFLSRAEEAAKQIHKPEWNTLIARTAEAEKSVFEAVVFDYCPDPNSEINLGDKKIQSAYFYPKELFNNLDSVAHRLQKDAVDTALEDAFDSSGRSLAPTQPTQTQ